MNILRGNEGTDHQLHYLIPYLAKWIDNQGTKNMQYYRFEPGYLSERGKGNSKNTRGWQKRQKKSIYIC